MNIFMLAHFVTAVLVVLKIANVIAVSWWIVFLPSILVLVVAAMVFLFTLWVMA